MTEVFQNLKLMWNRYYIVKHMCTQRLMHMVQDGDIKSPYFDAIV
jgi:hypothetical protein